MGRPREFHWPGGAGRVGGGRRLIRPQAQASDLADPRSLLEEETCREATRPRAPPLGLKQSTATCAAGPGGIQATTFSCGGCHHKAVTCTMPPGVARPRNSTQYWPTPGALHVRLVAPVEMCCSTRWLGVYELARGWSAHAGFGPGDLGSRRRGGSRAEAASARGHRGLGKGRRRPVTGGGPSGWSGLRPPRRSRPRRQPLPRDSVRTPWDRGRSGATTGAAGERDRGRRPCSVPDDGKPGSASPEGGGRACLCLRRYRHVSWRRPGRRVLVARMASRHRRAPTSQEARTEAAALPRSPMLTMSSAARRSSPRWDWSRSAVVYGP